MAVFLKVVGENILPTDYFNYNNKQPSRKVFNSDWDKVDEYQHEIGNHFRDYLNRKKLKRYYKRRRNPLKVVFEEQPCIYRDILPLNRIDFPESNSSVYHKLFKNCNCNTLRKIATTDSFSELRYLTKRQERLYKYKKVPSSTQGPPNHSNNPISEPNRRYPYPSKSGNPNLNHISSTNRNCIRFEHNRYVNGIDTNKVIREGVSPKKCSKEEDFSDDNDNCFFRLASECYDEGFLSHIEYLQSIVDRNAIKNTKNKRKKSHNNTEKFEPSSHPPTAPAVSSVSSSSSLEEFPNSVRVGRFASAVSRLIRNPVFKRNPCNTDQRDLKICVNIARSVSLESLNSNRSSGQKRKDFTRANRCIMSDFLNSAEAVVSSGIVDTNNSTNSTVKQQHFYDLVENLNRLEISDSGSLPKITISSADDDVKSSLFGSESNERTFLKQDSLEIDIPFFNDYYSSEARPP